MMYSFPLRSTLTWLGFALGLTIQPLAAQSPKLESVFQDKTYQLTGVAVSKSGRLFVNYPYWTDAYRYAVAEVGNDGVVKPYPDAPYNSWREGQPITTNRWICVQSVHVDAKDRLWVVDAASPKQNGVVGNAHRIVCINLATNRVEKEYPMKGVVGSDSYLNDIRVDTNREIAYLTESKQGGIVVLDIKSGKARLLLKGDKSVKADPTYKFVIDGRELRDNMGPVRFQSDGIAMTPDGNYLYYKPLSDNKLYRIKTDNLRNTALSATALATHVEDLGKVASTDGMIIDNRGNLYMGDDQAYTLYRLPGASSSSRPQLTKQVLLTDKNQLIWPDSYAIYNGYLYMTTSQIQHMAKNNGGKSTRKTPYGVWRLKIE
ncbi:L-dopachrome tautomerase-related protein [Spirosoma flavum]|uniref:L-dopachrome tautomerase-related protein n=1 Tax=Spirosoma flavum TaxID=2048557 RepID=A0ABW6ARV5_9BACT